MDKYLSKYDAFVKLSGCILLLAAVSIGCSGIKRPWRSYTEIPFSSADWLAGDKIERARMVRDMFRNSKVEISTRDNAIKTLGEPDLKKAIEGKEVWFYRVDIGIVGGMDLVPISFDEKGRGSVGYVHGGTMSIMEKEDEL